MPEDAKAGAFVGRPTVLAGEPLRHDIVAIDSATATQKDLVGSMMMESEFIEFSFLPLPSIEADGQEDDDADDHCLKVQRDAEEDERISDHGHDRRSE